MSEDVKIVLSASKAKMLREGVSRIRFWINGFRAAGRDHGVSLLEPPLIALQIALESAKPVKPKKPAPTSSRESEQP